MIKLMPIDYRKYPKDWKKVIRPAIMKRANNRCEQCGLKHYQVGYREGSWFTPARGNIYVDAAGNGELSYKEAKELIEHHNNFSERKLIIIVLTIAHLDNNVNNNDYSNLQALCQSCHNRMDVDFRKENRKATLNKKKGLIEMF